MQCKFYNPLSLMEAAQNVENVGKILNLKISEIIKM